MKTFSVKDFNKPMQFYTNCTGCVLVPKKMDQVVVITATGEHVTIGVQMPHTLSVAIYDKLMEAAQIGGTVVIPDMQQMNDDDIRAIVEEIEVEP
ncbi:MAG: hypothetical protein LUD01_06720 [Clostridiales bacterium]|nr:hypothetical protein [Clostridiales bacterium]